MTDPIASSVWDMIVALHPDGSECTAYSRPFAAPCPRVGSGVHDGMTDWSQFLSDGQLLDHLIGPVDIEHLRSAGQIRRRARWHK